MQLRLNEITKKTKDRIESDDAKISYSIIIPQFEYSLPFLTPKKYHELAEKILTSVGFKKGQVIGFQKYSRYYYKNSKDKNCIFTAYYISPTTASGSILSQQMQLYVQCAVNDEKTRSIVVEGSIFKDINVI